MTSLKRPMLAATLDTESLEKLDFPVMASVKLDGIRALVIDGVVYSRSMKSIPNSMVQEIFGKSEFNGFDGELIFGNPNDPNVYNRSMECMRHSPRNPEEFRNEIRFYVFDLHDSDAVFEERFKMLQSRIGHLGHRNLRVVPHATYGNLETLLEFETQSLKDGYEGIMVRGMQGKYKNGRATLKQQILGKVKRFQDSEAEILEISALKKTVDGFKIDELGYRKTSARKDTKQEIETMGVIRVRDIHSGVEFEIGSGFNQEQRDLFWQNKEEFIGKLVKYKFFEIGKEKPRFPIFQGFRSDLDL